MKSDPGSRRRLCVIGDPISHSLSPVLQSFLIEHFDLPFTYEAVRVVPNELPAFVEKLRAGEFAGASVTLPHKQAVMPLLEECSPTARHIGAVNTIVPEGGLLHGHNTDAAGFLRAAQAAQIDFKNQKVLLLGAGGAAKAVLHVLREQGAGAIHICNRDLARAEKWLAAGAQESQKELHLVEWEKREQWLQAGPVNVIINATSAGMPPQREISPLPAAALRKDLAVIDLIYNPPETLLLQEAKKAGARVLNGLPMLIHQGVAAMELWSGQKLDIGGIHAEIEKELLAAYRARTI